jgi:hypothetical protein
MQRKKRMDVGPTLQGDLAASRPLLFQGMRFLVAMVFLLQSNDFRRDKAAAEIMSMM